MRAPLRLALGLTFSSTLVLAGAASCGDDDPIFNPTTTATGTGGQSPGACDNGVQDGDETDVDCGGSCDPCDNGKACDDASDCASGFCDQGATGGSGGAPGTGGSGGDGTGGTGGGGIGVGGLGLGGAGGEGGDASGGDGTGGNGTGGGGTTGGTCAPCGGHDDCAGGNATECADGVCVPPTKNIGDGCTGDGQCISGFCPSQDGICCDAPCDGECVSCLASKTGGDNGTCSAVTADTDPDAECAATDPSTCGAIGAGCNGDADTPRCNVHPEGTVCGGSTCTAGEAAADQACDGEGSCLPGETSSCDPYTCNAEGTGCRLTCQNDSHCIATHYCGAGNLCLPRAEDGEPCTGANQCLSGFCPAKGNVCCAEACTAECKSCLGAVTGGDDGTCGNVQAGTDPHNDCLLTCNGNGACNVAVQ